jgi:hypothetical protein
MMGNKIRPVPKKFANSLIKGSLQADSRSGKSLVLYSSSVKNSDEIGQGAEPQKAKPSERGISDQGDWRDEADAAARRPYRLRQFQNQNFVFLSCVILASVFWRTGALGLRMGQEWTGSDTSGLEWTFFLEKII